MYKAFFGLSSNPFELSPDPFFMVSSEKSKEALASISGAVGRRKGFVVMTGEVGTGKTLVLRCLFELWEREQIPFAYFIGPRLSTVDFLSYINFELGIHVEEPTKGNLLRALYGFLLAEFEKGLTTVLIIDEAHQIPRSVLEEIRLLTNFETSQQKLIQIILAGQPELDKKLDSPELRSLKQRIAVRCTLEPLRPEEVRNYIERRLVLAGAEPQAAASIFPVETVKAIYRYSQGIQRLVNNICDQALVAACTSEIRVVPVEIVDQIAARFRLEPAPGRTPAERPLPPQGQMQGPAGAGPISSQDVPSREPKPRGAAAAADSRGALPHPKLETPTQSDVRNETEARTPIVISDNFAGDQPEHKPQTFERAETAESERLSSPESGSEAHQESYPKVSTFAPGSMFLAACQRVIDQAVASASDLRAIAHFAGDTATGVTPKHVAPNPAPTRLDPVATLKQEASVPPAATAKAAAAPAAAQADASVSPGSHEPPKAAAAPDLSATRVSTTAVMDLPDSERETAAPSSMRPLLTTAEVPKPEPTPLPAKPPSLPLAFAAAAATSAYPVIIRRNEYQPSAVLETPSAPEPPKPEPVPLPVSFSSPHVAVAEPSLVPPVTPPHLMYDANSKLPDMPDPDALSSYIAVLRANHNAEYFRKQQVNPPSGEDRAENAAFSDSPSGESLHHETPDEPIQGFTTIDKGILISAIIGGVLILGAATIRYLGRPSNSVQDTAMAAVTHASSPPGASPSTPENGAARSIASQGNPKTRPTAGLGSDLQVYKQLAEPSSGSKRSSPGQSRLPGPTIGHRDAAPSRSDAPAEPLIDSQATPSSDGLVGGLAAAGQPTFRPTAPPTGGEVKPARLLSSISPVYPQMAKNMRVEGTVLIDAFVDENGRVSTMKVVSGPVLLRQAALDALVHWKYQPATLDGKAIPMHTTIRMEFHVQ
jgi:general secretion pathway protein A